MTLQQKLASIPDLPPSALKVIADHSDWIPETVIPREGEDLLLKLNIEGNESIETGYYMEGAFYLFDGSGDQENNRYITHYQYSKYFL